MEFKKRLVNGLKVSERSRSGTPSNLLNGLNLNGKGKMVDPSSKGRKSLMGLGISSEHARPEAIDEDQENGQVEMEDESEEDDDLTFKFISQKENPYNLLSSTPTRASTQSTLPSVPLSAKSLSRITNSTPKTSHVFQAKSPFSKTLFTSPYQPHSASSSRFSNFNASPRGSNLMNRFMEDPENFREQVALDCLNEPEQTGIGAGVEMYMYAEAGVGYLEYNHDEGMGGGIMTSSENPFAQVDDAWNEVSRFLSLN
jgi:hypothetical protein